MCTVTWLRSDQGYDVFFNRDERHTRRTALPPTVSEEQNVRYLAPADGDALGSWLAVNTFGLTLCLLNFYAADLSPAGQGYISRGQLLVSQMHHASPAALGTALLDLDLSHYRPFFLVAFAKEWPPQVQQWDGRRLAARDLADSDRPLTTSSFRTASVVAARKACFARLVEEHRGISPDMLRAYHMSHDPEGQAHSVCMYRSDAQTVSFSRISVRRGAAEFLYRPRAPGGGPFLDGHLQSLTLDLA